jgi:hypothetical protein
MTRHACWGRRRHGKSGLRMRFGSSSGWQCRIVVGLERLHRHGMQSDSICALCDQQSETIDHLLLACVVSRQIWFIYFGKYGWQHLLPGSNDVFPEQWIHRWPKQEGRPSTPSVRSWPDAFGYIRMMCF